MFSPSREYSGIRDNGEGKGTEVSAYRAGPERSGGVGEWVWGLTQRAPTSVYVRMNQRAPWELGGAGREKGRRGTFMWDLARDMKVKSMGM